jgi:hypothetical protein
VSVLLPSTLRVLETARKPGQPLFPSEFAAKRFEEQYTRGPLRVLPRTVGDYVLVDGRRPFGQQTVDTFPTLAAAAAALNARSDAELPRLVDPLPDARSTRGDAP